MFYFFFFFFFEPEHDQFIGLYGDILHKKGACAWLLGALEAITKNTHYQG